MRNPAWFDALPLESKKQAAMLPLTAEDWENVFDMKTDEERMAYARSRFEEWANAFDRMGVDLYNKLWGRPAHDSI